MVVGTPRCQSILRTLYIRTDGIQMPSEIQRCLSLSRQIHPKINQITQHLESRSLLIPAPYIQSNLGPRPHRQRCMPRLPIPRAIRLEILPKYRIPFNRPKRNSLRLIILIIIIIIIITLNKPTPFGRSRPPQPREICSPALALRINVDHKRAHSVPVCVRGTCPVVMVPVEARSIVSLSPHRFNGQVWSPALERAGAGFEALHDTVIGGQEGAVGEAYGGVDAFRGAVEDG